jgi:hypothetical protein
MTSDTPAPSPDAPDSTIEPSRSLGAELLTTTLPATTAGTAVTDPKLPPFRGD